MDGQFPDRVPIQPENKSSLLLGNKETYPCHTDPQLFPDSWVYLPKPTVLRRFPAALPGEDGTWIGEICSFLSETQEGPFTSQDQAEY